VRCFFLTLLFYSLPLFFFFLCNNEAPDFCSVLHQSGDAFFAVADFLPPTWLVRRLSGNCNIHLFVVSVVVVVVFFSFSFFSFALLPKARYIRERRTSRVVQDVVVVVIFSLCGGICDIGGANKCIVEKFVKIKRYALTFLFTLPLCLILHQIRLTARTHIFNYRCFRRF
jgi:hypothetical protein